MSASKHFRAAIVAVMIPLGLALGTGLVLTRTGAGSTAPATDAVDTTAGDLARPPASRDRSPAAQRRAAPDTPANARTRWLRGRVLCASAGAPVAARIGTDRGAVFSSAETGWFDGALTVAGDTSVSVSAPGFQPRSIELGDDAWREVLLRPVREGRVRVRGPDRAPVAGADIRTATGGARVSLGVTDDHGELTIATGRALLVWAESGGSLSAVELMEPEDSTELLLEVGGGRIGLRLGDGGAAPGVPLRVRRIDASVLRTDNEQELVTGPDGTTPPLPYGIYLVGSATSGVDIAPGPSPEPYVPHRRARYARLSAEEPTAWLAAVVKPSLAARVVDASGAPWPAPVKAWLENADGRRTSHVLDFEPDRAGIVSIPILRLDDVSSTLLCLTAERKAVTRIPAPTAGQRPPPETVLRDGAEVVHVRVVTADGGPVDFPLQLVEVSGIGRIEVFAGIPDGDGIRFAWRGGDLWASESTGDDATLGAWPLARLPAARIGVPGPNELRLERFGRLVVDTPRGFAGPLFCSLRPGAMLRAGRLEDGQVVFDRLPPGDYAVGSRGWVESASLRWTHSRLGPVRYATRVDTGRTTRVPWDAAWSRVDVTGAVAATGVDPRHLLVYPIHAESHFPVSIAPFSRSARVRSDGSFCLSDLDGMPEYLVVASVDTGGSVVPYAVGEPGSSVQVAAGDLVVRVTGIDAGQHVACAYDPRVPGTQLYQDVEAVIRGGLSGEPIDLRAVPTYVNAIRVRVGDRLEAVPVRVVPAQRTELVVPWR